MQDERLTTVARVVSFADFAAARARRQAEQLNLFDQPAEAARQSAQASRPLTARGVEHRQRMLRHLTTAQA